jgi:ABC-type lipoprotein release transport system permease subunit
MIRQGQRSRAAGLSFRLAWRNIWRQKRRTWLTAMAMVFSNTLLVFMIGLQLGSYEMMINNTLAMFTGQAQVQSKGYREAQKMRMVMEDISSLTQRLRENLPGASVAARAQTFVMISSEDRSFGVQIVGVEPGFEPDVSSIPGLVRDGRYLEGPQAAEIVIGSVMARNLGVGQGDELTFLGSGRDGSFAAGVVQVAGIFESGSQDLDRSMAMVPLAYFQEAFSMGDSGHVIVLAAGELGSLPPMLKLAARTLSQRPELVLLDWDALVPGLKQAIQADMTSAWFMYGVLILLVAFSVLNTQLMSVLERTREFGVIMALGVKPRRLAWLVLLETFLMALLGFVIGVGLGTLVTSWFAHAGFAYPGMEQMAAKFNLPAYIYPSLEPISVLLGPSVVLLFCLVAAVYPALKLYRLNPVRAMRSV